MLRFCVFCRQAYLIFGNKEQTKNVVQNFKRQPCRLDGNRLILLRWNTGGGLPAGKCFANISVITSSLRDGAIKL
jgi:hypothetical protein